MFKRILSLFLVSVLVFGTVSTGFVGASAADDTMETLISLIKKFPHGKYWNHHGTSNNPNKVSSTPCTCHRGRCDYFGGCDCNSYGGAIQCMGYAAKVSYDITGVDRGKYKESHTLDVSKLRVGDIVRSRGHSVCITGVSGNRISFTDCNYGDECIIRWVTVDADWFGRVEYVLHLEGNERTNTDVEFHKEYNGIVTEPETPDEPDEPDTPEEDFIEGAEIWQMSADDSLNIRVSKSTSASLVGSIPASAKFNVFDKEVKDGYLWGKVSYKGKEGYSALNYAKHISGEYETPELVGLQKIYYTATGVNLTWEKVSGADNYAISVYDDDNKFIKEFNSKTNSYTIDDPNPGKYFVVVTAESSYASSWKTQGEKKSFSVVVKTIPLTKLSILKKGAIDVSGSSVASAKVTFEPANATNKALVWTSSDNSVATVDSNGIVRGIAPGKTIIKCTSKENPKLSASCELTVRPSEIKTIQTTKGTTKTSIGLKWSASKGATGYILYRYNTATKSYVKLAQGMGNSYTDKNLKVNTKYTYVVRPFAKTDDGVIYASYKAVTAMTAPSPISTVRQTGSDTGRVRIEWAKQEGVYGYVIYKYNPTTKKFYKLGITKNNGFVDTDKPATKVYYKILSGIKTGDGYVYSDASATITGITGLEKPVLASKSGTNSVTVGWKSVKYATHYQIYRIVDGKPVHLDTVSASTLYYTDKNLKKGQTYTYYVRAARKHSATLNLFSGLTGISQKVVS